MGAIIERARKGGGKSYLAQVKIVRDGKVVHRENRTFERRQAAAAWLEKRESELRSPGGLERAKSDDPTLAMVIRQYITESTKALGRTKAQVLRTIQGYAIADKAISTITSADLVAMLRVDLKDVTPATRGNYLAHLSSIFAVARPAWGYAVDHQTIKDAAASAKRLGLIGKPQSRERRPSLDELDLILSYFKDRERRRPYMVPMTRIILFALFSARRQEEIVRIRWPDLDEANKRVLVRDMKNPGEKAGNNVWCDLPEPALKIVLGMPKPKEGAEDDRIFPYTTDAVSANFARACKWIGIEDLTFHDLRHEGASRLFEMGLNIPHVAAVTGHRSWSSLKRYTHIRSSGDKYEGWKWLKLADEPYQPGKVRTPKPSIPSPLRSSARRSKPQDAR